MIVVTSQSFIHRRIQWHAALKTPQIESLQDLNLRNYTENVATVILADPQIDLINTRRHAKLYGRYTKSEGQGKLKGHVLDLIFHQTNQNLFKGQVQA